MVAGSGDLFCLASKKISSPNTSPLYLARLLYISHFFTDV